MSVPQTQETKVETTEQKTNNAEYNFAQLRKKAEEAEARARQAEERIAQIEKATSMRKEVSEDDSLEASDDPYVDHKYLKKSMNKMLADVDQRIDRKAEEKARALVEQERRTNYLKQNADFNEIMQPEVIQKFAEKHPNIAEGFLALPESFERQKLLYESIKALGAHRKEEPKSIQSTIDNNRRGPFYRPTDVSSNPYSAGGNYTPSGMKDAYAKMQELKSKLRI